MRSIAKPALAVIAAAAAAVSLAGCSTGGGNEAVAAEGKPFTVALSTDPGSLDPHASAVSALFAVSRYAYDPLVSINLDGEISSALAKDWSLDGLTATLTLNEGITCSDGADFTAQTAADNITWIEDPANQSPFLGAFLPAGMTATAEGDTLTLALAAPAPFLFQSLSNLGMVCDAGLADRSTLAAGTNGTGPYVLTEAVPNDHYTYELNEDYAWGPGGLTAEKEGLPSSVTARIIGNETTAANLLLSGEINAVQVVGPDAERLDAAKLFTQETPALLGEQWYNHTAGHPTADPAVRLALTQSLDLAELQKVLTSGKGGPATQLAVIPPTGCTVDSVSGNIPEFDVDAAEAALDEAGWAEGADGVRAKDGQKLSITFLYDSTLGTGGAAAAELAVAAWQGIGIEVTAAQQDSTTISDNLFGTGAWDVAWEPLNINSPDQIIGFLSGPAAPEGVNFSGIQNDEYTALVTEAMGMVGSEGCDTWADAEAALFTAADVVPFANNFVKTYGAGAEFAVVGNIVPTSITMLD